VCLAALAWLAWAVARKKTRAVVYDSRLGPLILFLLAALVFNAAATGVLSGVFSRYEARIVWLLPLAAMLTARAAVESAGRRRPPPGHGRWPTRR
jgi:hypothetical protein